MRLCIDFCSGLAGFSQAFKDAGWEVVTVDIDSRFNPTIVADILTLKASEVEAKVELKSFRAYEKVAVLASPPCERFSLASGSWPKAGIRKALEIVGACIELIIEIKPDAWLLENPKGRLRWFLGAPPHSVKLSDYGYTYNVQGGKLRRSTKPTDLWGNIQFPMLESEKINPPRKGNTGWTDERFKRALMPYGLSKAVLEAISKPLSQEGSP